MTSCAIFSASSYVEAVCQEINHLADQTRAILTELGWDARDGKGSSLDDSHSGLRYARHFSLSRAYSHQRKPAELILHFDLFRPPFEGNWGGAKTALLLVGYSSSPGQGGWESDTLAPQDSGQMTDADTRECLSPILDDRLMIWDRPDGASDYARSEWLFALKLSDITDADALNRMVILPIRSLLAVSGDPREALQTADAIPWPKQTV